jgi:hypothetical protein
VEDQGAGERIEEAVAVEVIDKGMEQGVEEGGEDLSQITLLTLVASSGPLSSLSSMEYGATPSSAQPSTECTPAMPRTSLPSSD